MVFWKEVKKGALLTALLYIALGLVLMIWPGMTAMVMCYTLAGVLAAVGIGYVIGFFVQKAKEPFVRYDLVIGLVLLILAAFLFFRAKLVISIIPFLLGFVITFDGLVKLQHAIDLKRLGYRKWLLVLAMSLLGVAFGVLLLVNPFEGAETLLLLIGIGLFFSGITDIITVFCMAKRMSDLRQGGGESVVVDD